MDCNRRSNYSPTRKVTPPLSYVELLSMAQTYFTLDIAVEPVSIYYDDPFLDMRIQVGSDEELFIWSVSPPAFEGLNRQVC